jgi:hypothetical protein
MFRGAQRTLQIGIEIVDQMRVPLHAALVPARVHVGAVDDGDARHAVAPSSKLEQIPVEFTHNRRA